MARCVRGGGLWPPMNADERRCRGDATLRKTYDSTTNHYLDAATNDGGSDRLVRDHPEGASRGRGELGTDAGGVEA